MAEQKWAIPEENLKIAFGKLEIDTKYYPLFVEEATKALNEIAIGYDPEQDDIDGSLEIATDFMNIYVGQIEAGLSKVWAEAYANHHINEDMDDSAWEAFMAVSKSQGYEQAKKELDPFARFLDDDPSFVENYVYFFIYKWTIEDVKEFTRIKNSLIEKGKSEVYAREYALHHNSTPDDVFCHLFAFKFEECINKGIETDKAYTIAEAYEDCYDLHYPQDNDIEGKKFIDVYIQGFEYAIVNGINPPEKFAEEYRTAYYDKGEKPSYVAKGEYDDSISKLLADKM
ncbi:hypothetical protein SAMN05216354_1642 [Xylanibacter ruminicola]|uniref:Uncharacterized protein n=1 Tax=Xylanibacter ruminicola TaxID=839 RepID=A0A1H5V0P7_XYLRU|nr:hypothetical protein [Xylanibacter ruminicola]SEF80271.1 hypothetical protein SAMN05216354_1642 [Xylanibacter ruminicola]